MLNHIHRRMIEDGAEVNHIAAVFVDGLKKGVNKPLSGEALTKSNAIYNRSSDVIKNNQPMINSMDSYLQEKITLFPLTERIK